MTSLRVVQHHVRGLRDIRAILNSMKSLAYMEVQKLSRIVPAQRAVSARIDAAAVDLLAHYPEVLPPAALSNRILIVLGTERGFCNNHNQRLLERLRAEAANSQSGSNRIIAVGRKLHSILRDSDLEQFVLLEGAGVAEEAPRVLNEIVDQLALLRNANSPAAVSAIYYDNQGRLGVRSLLPPPFRDLPAPASILLHEPVLNLSPERLLLDLTDQCLFSSLFEILYESLLTENLRRVQHLSDAVHHLDKETVALTNRANVLRQEKITEEIEVLLLSTGIEGSRTKDFPRDARAFNGPVCPPRASRPAIPLDSEERGGTHHARQEHK